MHAVATGLSSFCDALQVIEHLKLRKRRRFKTTEELEAFFAAKDFSNGLECSCTQKRTIMREKTQLRKKLDGVVKVGETQLHNFSDTKKHPTPLPGLWALFNLMCARESLPMGFHLS
jgi:hypothetical protein